MIKMKWKLRNKHLSDINMKSIHLVMTTSLISVKYVLQLLLKFLLVHDCTKISAAYLILRADVLWFLPIRAKPIQDYLQFFCAFASKWFVFATRVLGRCDDWTRFENKSFRRCFSSLPCRLQTESVLDEAAQQLTCSRWSLAGEALEPLQPLGWGNRWESKPRPRGKSHVAEAPEWSSSSSSSREKRPKNRLTVIQ